MEITVGVQIDFVTTNSIHHHWHDTVTCIITRFRFFPMCAETDGMLHSQRSLHVLLVVDLGPGNEVCSEIG